MTKNTERIRYTLRFTAQGKRLIARAAAACGVRPEEFLYRVTLNCADAIVEERKKRAR
jgi:uncharacterized protein (DUF1778 family)